MDSHILVGTTCIFLISVNNDRLKLAVCEARGIQELLRVVDAVGHATTGGPGGKSKHELLEPAVCALRHLTNNHKVTEGYWLWPLAKVMKMSGPMTGALLFFSCSILSPSAIDKKSEVLTILELDILGMGKVLWGNSSGTGWDGVA